MKQVKRYAYQYLSLVNFEKYVDKQFTTFKVNKQVLSKSEREIKEIELNPLVDQASFNLNTATRAFMTPLVMYYKGTYKIIKPRLLLQKSNQHRGFRVLRRRFKA